MTTYQNILKELEKVQTIFDKGGPGYDLTFKIKDYKNLSKLIYQIHYNSTVSENEERCRHELAHAKEAERQGYDYHYAVRVIEARNIEKANIMVEYIYMVVIDTSLLNWDSIPDLENYKKIALAPKIPSKIDLEIVEAINKQIDYLTINS